MRGRPFPIKRGTDLCPFARRHSGGAEIERGSRVEVGEGDAAAQALSQSLPVIFSQLRAFILSYI